MIDKTLSVPERLIAARGELSRQEAADALGISVSAIAMYETGQRVPRDSIKPAMARLYRVSIEDLFY